MNLAHGWTDLIQQEQKPRKSDLTRQAILKAAEEFLRTSPVSDLSVVELMKIVGCSRPVFYQYFDDIYELILVALDDFTQEVLELAERSAWFHDPDDAPAALALMQTEVHQIAYKRAVIFRASQEAAAQSELLRLAWKQMMAEYDDRVTKAIQRDQAAGLIGDLDAILVAKSLNRMNLGNMVLHFGGKPRTQLKRLLPSVIHIWVSCLYGDDAAMRLK